MSGGNQLLEFVMVDVLSQIYILEYLRNGDRNFETKLTMLVHSTHWKVAGAKDTTRAIGTPF